MSLIDPNFPCTITITIPLPTPRLAKIAQRVLSVDAELSPLVRRTIAIISFSTLSLSQHVHPHDTRNGNVNGNTITTATNGEHKLDAPSQSAPVDASNPISEDDLSVLQTTYSATTNRMLRVAVNGFIESVGVVLEVMAEHDVEQ